MKQKLLSTLCNIYGTAQECHLRQFKDFLATLDLSKN